jgi:hypothetical protein
VARPVPPHCREKGRFLTAEHVVPRAAEAWIEAILTEYSSPSCDVRAEGGMIVVESAWIASVIDRCERRADE